MGSPAAGPVHFHDTGQFLYDQVHFFLGVSNPQTES